MAKRYPTRYAQASISYAKKTVTSIRVSFFLVLMVTVTPFITFAQAPNISYSGGAQTYKTGVAISPLTPVNTGGAVGSNVPVSIATGFFDPQRICIDAIGNIYLADDNYELGEFIIYKIPVNGTARITLTEVSDLSDINSIAADALGNVYFTMMTFDPDVENIYKFLLGAL